MCLCVLKFLSKTVNARIIAIFLKFFFSSFILSYVTLVKLIEEMVKRRSVVKCGLMREVREWFSVNCWQNYYSISGWIVSGPVTDLIAKKLISSCLLLLCGFTSGIFVSLSQSVREIFEDLWGLYSLVNFFLPEFFWPSTVSHPTSIIPKTSIKFN